MIDSIVLVRDSIFGCFFTKDTEWNEEQRMDSIFFPAM
jgi:hypothetical protein